MATILLVEDDKIAINYCKLLVGKKHQIVEVTNTDDALQILAQSNPDLVITDLMLPNSKGIFPSRSNSTDFIGTLRSINSTVKILVYSALCQETKIQNRAIALGANTCLVKTCSIKVFRKTVSSLLGLGTV